MFHQSNEYHLGSCVIPKGEHLPNWEHSSSAVNLDQSNYSRSFLGIHSTSSHNDLSVCKICLASHCKMSSVTRSDLLELLYSLFDSNMPADLISPTVCWECRSRLESATRLKKKGRRAQILLMELSHTVQEIDSETVKHVDRNKHGLTSSLGVCETQINYFDPMKEELLIIKEENTDTANEITANEITANEITEANTFDDSNDSDDKLLIDVAKEDSTSDIWSDSDADVLPFLHLAKEHAESVKKRAKNCSKKKRVWKKKNSATGPNIDRKARGEVNVILSKSFDVKKLSLNEQREEFEKRKKKESYLSKDYKCTICYTGFEEELKYKNHLLLHEEVWGKYPCPICNKRTKSKHYLHNHISNCHTAQYTCRECELVTLNRKVAINHLKGHSDTNFKCPLCPAEFSHPSSYLNHRRVYHASECVCELCGYAFVNEAGIKMHKWKTHPLDKSVLAGPYCEACNVTFVSEEAYTKHLDFSSKHISDDKRLEMRNDCNYKTVGLGLKKSMRTTNSLSKTPITCEVCGVVVIGLRAYAHHFRKQHPGDKRVQFPKRQPSKFMCDQCGKQFQIHTHLENHMAVHTGIRSFQCDICLKKFMTKSSLTLHLNRHNSNAKYQCSECGRNFKYQSNMSRHRLMHIEVQAHKCSYCDKTFKWAGSLVMHVKHVHQNVPWPKRDRSARRLTRC